MPNTTLTAWNLDRGLLADVVVPGDRTAKVRVHFQKGVGTHDDLCDLRRAGRYLTEEPHAASMRLDSGWVISQRL
jgi:hypothetical protein